MPQNPIVGGTILRRPAIQSPNFVTGVSGWTINADGSAEFNNLTIRGVFDGTDFEINSSGIFFYSGTPANGNLIAWAANADGTDAHGNLYYKGLGSQAPGSQVSLLQDGVLAIGSVTQTAAATQALFDWLSDGESALTSGKVNVSDPVQAVLDLQSQSKSGITNGQAYFEVGKLILGITATAWWDDNTQQLNVPSAKLIAGTTPGTPSGGYALWSDSGSAGQLSAIRQSGLAGRIDINQSDLSTNTNANNGTQPITKSWSIPASDAVAGCVYRIEVPVSGTLQAQQLNIGLIQDGIFVNVVPIAAAAYGAGTAIAGTIRATVKILTTGAGGTAQWDFDGAITNNGVNRTTATSVGVLGRRASNAFETTASHTLAIGAQWAVPTAGQTISGFGSNFVRSGP